MQRHDPETLEALGQAIYTEAFLDDDDAPPVVVDDLNDDPLDDLDQELVRQMLTPLNGTQRGSPHA
jgi:hypothetical protein